MDTVKGLEEMGADDAQIDELREQAALSLEDSWGVEDTAGLLEMADWLMNEGHNKDAMDFLNGFGGTEAAGSRTGRGG